MRMTLESACRATQRSPVGIISLILSCFCGITYLATLFVPQFFPTSEFSPASENSTILFIIVTGSGVAFLLALLSFGLERPMWPGATALIVVVVTEFPVILVMPFWVLMLLGGWSGWAVAAYLAAVLVALVLIVRRALTGRVVIETPAQFGRCPLIGALNSRLGLQ